MKKNKRENPFKREKMSISELVLKLSITFFCVVTFLASFICFDGIKFFEDSRYVDSFSSYEFQIHTIDVENGDAFLIKLPGNKTMMIDCGERDYEGRVLSYVKQFMHKQNVK